jgi:hypothetical protein
MFLGWGGGGIINTLCYMWQRVIEAQIVGIGGHALKIIKFMVGSTRIRIMVKKL